MRQQRQEVQPWSHAGWVNSFTFQRITPPTAKNTAHKVASFLESTGFPSFAVHPNWMWCPWARKKKQKILDFLGKKSKRFYLIFLMLFWIFCFIFVFRIQSWALWEPGVSSVWLAHGIQVWDWWLADVLLQHRLSSAGGEGDCVLGRWPSYVECTSAKVCGYVVICFYSFFMFFCT